MSSGLCLRLRRSLDHVPNCGNHCNKIYQILEYNMKITWEILLWTLVALWTFKNDPTPWLMNRTRKCKNSCENHYRKTIKSLNMAWKSHERPFWAPFLLSGRLKMTPRRPKGPQMPPKRTQMEPKGSPKSPNGAQSDPRGLQNGAKIDPKDHPKARKVNYPFSYPQKLIFERRYHGKWRPGKPVLARNGKRA